MNNSGSLAIASNRVFAPFGSTLSSLLQVLLVVSFSWIPFRCSFDGCGNSLLVFLLLLVSGSCCPHPLLFCVVEDCRAILSSHIIALDRTEWIAMESSKPVYWLEWDHACARKSRAIYRKTLDLDRIWDELILRDQSCQNILPHKWVLLWCLQCTQLRSIALQVLAGKWVPLTRSIQLQRWRVVLFPLLWWSGVSHKEEQRLVTCTEESEGRCWEWGVVVMGSGRSGGVAECVIPVKQPQHVLCVFFFFLFLSRWIPWNAQK